ncbi:endospore germination permease [Brevibacillus choshinensis]|uniref:GerAB/ArcD/ProY family transporter n=1 Tax=Brevibacillus choshinensis TaxID=54911 RepID=UPI002E1DF42D|nr:endospore germination permease [Brevibacillus choshinensis]MED4582406.1 endospore germination permease [Brevibacillus choshinensis]MED4781092.1 endospore germination permease [Brevibacillus choshinensis]
MKTNEFNDITTFQYILFISQVQIGIGIITLPSDLAEVASTDGWISILLGWVLANVAGLLILQIMKRHPNESIFDLLIRYLGKWLGTLGSGLFILYSLFVFMITLYAAIHITQTWVLPQTPNYLLMILFIIPKHMLAQHGIRMLGRYAEFVGVSMIIMLPLFFIAMREGHWIHLLPVLKEGWLPVLKGVKTTILSFLGFELAFILYPFLQKKQHAAFGMIVANTITMLVYMLVTIACYVQFNPYQIKTYIWPTLDLFETIEFPFIERIEVVFSAFYLFIISTSGIPYYFTSAFGISQLLRKQNHRQVILVLSICFIFLAFVFNPTFFHVSAIQKWGAKVGMYVAYFFPVCFWLYIVTTERIQVRLNQ